MGRAHTGGGGCSWGHPQGGPKPSSTSDLLRASQAARDPELSPKTAHQGAGRGLLAGRSHLGAWGLPLPPCPAPRRTPAPTDVVFSCRRWSSSISRRSWMADRLPAGPRSLPKLPPRGLGAGPAGDPGLGGAGAEAGRGRGGRGREARAGRARGATARRAGKRASPSLHAAGRAGPTHIFLDQLLLIQRSREVSLAPEDEHPPRRGQGSDQAAAARPPGGGGPGASTPPPPAQSRAARPSPRGLTGMPCSWGLSSRLWSLFLEASIFFLVSEGPPCTWGRQVGMQLTPQAGGSGAATWVGLGRGSEGQPAWTTGPARVPPGQTPGEAAARPAKLGNTGPVR